VGRSEEPLDFLSAGEVQAQQCSAFFLMVSRPASRALSMPTSLHTAIAKTLPYQQMLLVQSSKQKLG
jgi:hypothetical protein